MGILVQIHEKFRHAASNKNEAEVEGQTVGECLSNLVRLFPAIKKELFGPNGKLSERIDIWVNDESAFPEELAKKVMPGDELYIIPCGG